jgi:hypothetical protein
MQQDLPFTDEEGSEEEASLFDDGEDDTGEEESWDEQQHRRSELHIVENGGEE